MRKIFTLLLIGFLTNSLFASSSALELAKATAQLEGKLILVHFGNSEKPGKLRNSPALWEISEKFVIVLMDIYGDADIFEQYAINSPASFLFLDAFGNKLYSTDGGMQMRNLKQIFASFPADVKEFNKAYQVFLSNEKNNLSVLQVAEICQQYGLKSKGVGAKAFSKLSESFFAKARRLSKAQNDQLILDKIQILKTLNVINKGNLKKGIPQLESMLVTDRPMDIRNEALVYYYLAISYMGLGNEEKVKFYRNELKENTGGKVYWRRLNGLMGTTLL